MPRAFCFFVAFAAAIGAVGCSSASSGSAACTDSTCSDASAAADASVAVDASDDTATAVDAAADVAHDASCPPYVDEAGVTHGCNQGGQGIGDHDDGGGMDAQIPDVAMDAMNLPFGSPCWDNAQCSTNVCYDFRAKGQFCTKACASNDDCPNPLVGCNGMGFCREP
jgi:hypothetical protein